MGQHGNKAVAVTGRSAVWAWLAFACDADAHFVVDAGRDLYFGGHLLENLSASAAVRAGVLDHRALTVAGGAGCLNSHDAGGLDNTSLATAIAADLATASLGGAAAFALVAGFMALELDRLGGTLRG